MERERLLPDRNYEAADLGHHIVARYGRSPGLIPIETTLQRVRRTGLFGHDRLPLLARLSRRRGGMNRPYPGSGGTLTFLLSTTTGTTAPNAPLAAPVLAREAPPSARQTGKRMITEASTTPSAPVATKSGSAIVRRRRSAPETATPDPRDEPPARRPEATDTAMVAPVEKLADGIIPSPLPLSPTDAGIGRPIIRRRKHPSPDAPARTTASVTTGTEPPLRIGLQSREKESTIRRTVLPLPAADQPVPATGVSAQSSPALPPRSESARREEPSSIETSAAIPSREDLGTAIQSRHATTTFAESARPAPLSMALPRQGRPWRIDRSEAAVGVFAGARPGTSTTGAPRSIAAASPAIAFPIPEPRAAAARPLAEQPTRAWDPAPPSSPVGRPATATPGAEIGSTDALSRARSPMPLVVQREPQPFSADQARRGPSPTATWQAGNAGHSSTAIGGHREPSGQGSGSMTAVHIEDLDVGTEVGPHPPRTGHGNRPNVDDLVDKVFRMLMRRLTVERERRGRQPWF